tara:strand:- start:59 stop:289 length:231 start_codon:yes stop_codon:yes gene_type:complete
MHDSQVKWKCRKGLRELDILLSRYFDEKYPTLPDRDKLVFIDFLELDTYEILDMLTNKINNDTKYKNILLVLKSLN